MNMNEEMFGSNTDLGDITRDFAYEYDALRSEVLPSNTPADDLRKLDMIVSLAGEVYGPVEVEPGKADPLVEFYKGAIIAARAENLGLALASLVVDNPEISQAIKENDQKPLNKRSF